MDSDGTGSCGSGYSLSAIVGEFQFQCFIAIKSWDSNFIIPVLRNTEIRNEPRLKFADSQLRKGPRHWSVELQQDPTNPPNRFVRNPTGCQPGRVPPAPQPGTLEEIL